jgi:hypothetical protein
MGFALFLSGAFLLLLGGLVAYLVHHAPDE